MQKILSLFLTAAVMFGLCVVSLTTFAEPEPNVLVQEIECHPTPNWAGGANDANLPLNQAKYAEIYEANGMQTGEFQYFVPELSTPNIMYDAQATIWQGVADNYITRMMSAAGNMIVYKFDLADTATDFSVTLMHISFGFIVEASKDGSAWLPIGTDTNTSINSVTSAVFPKTENSTHVANMNTVLQSNPDKTVYIRMKVSTGGRLYYQSIKITASYLDTDVSMAQLKTRLTPTMDSVNSDGRYWLCDAKGVWDNTFLFEKSAMSTLMWNGMYLVSFFPENGYKTYVFELDSKAADFSVGLRGQTYGFKVEASKDNINWEPIWSVTDDYSTMKEYTMTKTAESEASVAKVLKNNPSKTVFIRLTAVAAAGAPLCLNRFDFNYSYYLTQGAYDANSDDDPGYGGDDEDDDEYDGEVLTQDIECCPFPTWSETTIQKDIDSFMDTYREKGPHTDERQYLMSRSSAEVAGWNALPQNNVTRFLSPGTGSVIYRFDLADTAMEFSVAIQNSGYKYTVEASRNSASYAAIGVNTSPAMSENGLAVYPVGTDRTAVENMKNVLKDNPEKIVFIRLTVNSGGILNYQSVKITAKYKETDESSASLRYSLAVAPENKESTNITDFCFMLQNESCIPDDDFFRGKTDATNSYWSSITGLGFINFIRPGGSATYKFTLPSTTSDFVIDIGGQAMSFTVEASKDNRNWLKLYDVSDSSDGAKTYRMPDTAMTSVAEVLKNNPSKTVYIRIVGGADQAYGTSFCMSRIYMSCTYYLTKAAYDENSNDDPNYVAPTAQKEHRIDVYPNTGNQIDIDKFQSTAGAVDERPYIYQESYPPPEAAGRNNSNVERILNNGEYIVYKFELSARAVGFGISALCAYGGYKVDISRNRTTWYNVTDANDMKKTGAEIRTASITGENVHSEESIIKVLSYNPTKTVYVKITKVLGDDPFVWSRLILTETYNIAANAEDLPLGEDPDENWDFDDIGVFEDVYYGDPVEEKKKEPVLPPPPETEEEDEEGSNGNNSSANTPAVPSGTKPETDENVITLQMIKDLESELEEGVTVIQVIVSGGGKILTEALEYLREMGYGLKIVIADDNDEILKIMEIDIIDSTGEFIFVFNEMSPIEESTGSYFNPLKTIYVSFLKDTVFPGKMKFTVQNDKEMKKGEKKEVYGFNRQSEKLDLRLGTIAMSGDEKYIQVEAENMTDFLITTDIKTAAQKTPDANEQAESKSNLLLIILLICAGAVLTGGAAAVTVIFIKKRKVGAKI